MRQIIYADIFFIINLCMNFLALFAAGRITGVKLSLLRLLSASAFGAVYSIFTLFFESVIVPVIIINISVSVIMCLIAFRTETLIKFIKLFIIFYAACFILGGGIQALYNIFGTRTDGNVPPIQVILISAAVCTIIFIFTGRLFKRRANIDGADILIGFGGREIKVSAILDTGNLLRDPVSSLPVIIINFKSAAGLFDLRTLEFFTADSPYYISKISAAEPDKFNLIKKLKYKIIPVKSIAGANNILPAFVPEYIKYKKNRIISEINAVVAVDSGENETYGGDYSGIIPAELID